MTVTDKDMELKGPIKVSDPGAASAAAADDKKPSDAASEPKEGAK